MSGGMSWNEMPEEYRRFMNENVTITWTDAAGDPQSATGKFTGSYNGFACLDWAQGIAFSSADFSMGVTP
jgi:hypothetical protein